VLTYGGVTWVRLSEAVEQLGEDVTPAMVRAWARGPGVGAMLVGRERWYALEDLQEREHATRTSERGRPRRVVV
jgi:hypothetical protein